MPVPAIAVVLFDLGGVLFHYQPENRWQAFAEQVQLSPDDVKKRLSSSGFAMACEQGRYRGRRAFEEGLLALGKRMSMERFIHLWVSAFQPDEAVLEIARRTQHHAAIAMFSNNSDLVRQGLEGLWPAVLAPFMPRIFSADLGLAKPDPRAYQKVALLLGHSPEQILVIDDALSNTATAASLGFDVVGYQGPDALAEALAARNLL